MILSEGGKKLCNGLLFKIVRDTVHLNICLDFYTNNNFKIHQIAKSVWKLLDLGLIFMVWNRLFSSAKRKICIFYYYTKTFHMDMCVNPLVGGSFLFQHQLPPITPQDVSSIPTLYVEELDWAARCPLSYRGKSSLKSRGCYSDKGNILLPMMST